MHILFTNDDGPPSSLSSPYIHSLVHSLQEAGHQVSVVLPDSQKSWIGKAHLPGVTIEPTYFRPGTLFQNDGTTHTLPMSEEAAMTGAEAKPGQDEWVLVNSTPATCVQIGLHHFFQEKGPVDLVVSGPNYGRNTSALYSLSSGTLGGAFEGAVCNHKAIAVSYAFLSRQHDPEVIMEASRHSVKLIHYLYHHWESPTDVYSVNVPLIKGVSSHKIVYANMLENRWGAGHGSFKEVDPENSDEGPAHQEHNLRTSGELEASTGVKGSAPTYHPRRFKWEPPLGDIAKSVEKNEPGNDAWAVNEGFISVTPLKASYRHAINRQGEEIELQSMPNSSSSPAFHALIDYEDEYVHPLILEALNKQLPVSSFKVITSLDELPSASVPVLQYCAYDNADFEHVLSHPSTSLLNSYIFRKALIRKHYLSRTVEHWAVKAQDRGQLLLRHVKPSVPFELDYVEFLDEALMDCYDLADSFVKNEGRNAEEKEWWILKPGMCDRGQGLRIFESEERLRQIFEEWEGNEPDSEEEEEEKEEKKAEDSENKISTEEQQKKLDNAVIVSQIRHFIAQPYITSPLLLPSMNNRKFHIRTYVLSVGALKVYVYREMLALFAQHPYREPWEAATDDPTDDLTRHLTNTCLQDSAGFPTADSVRRFWDLEDLTDTPLDSIDKGMNWKESVYDQICAVTGEIFQAAARTMMIHFQTLPNAFEIFGVDFLVDASGNVWLLELNSFPDFKQTGEYLKEKVIGGLLEAVVDAAIKPFFFRAEGEEGSSEAQNLAEGQETKGGLRLAKVLDMGRL